MKKLNNIAYIILSLGSIFFYGCKNKEDRTLSFESPKSDIIYAKGDPINVRLNIPFDGLDSVIYFADGQVIKKNTDTSSFIYETKDLNFGDITLSAKAYHKGKEEITYSHISLLPKAPDLYTFEVINTYEHDSTAFTQGLEYNDGILYESTGKNGHSSIRKVDLKTGKVLQIKHLDEEYFGEGMTIIGEKLYQLTWKSNIIFVYDKKTLNLLQSYHINEAQEGWGLTYDGKHLIQTTGQDILYFRDLNNVNSIVRKVKVFDNNGSVSNLNELEFINGKIYANLYYGDRDEIVIINPENGVVEGRINFVGLYNGKRMAYDTEMNGIAYDKKSNNLYVTGKNWTKLFEVKIIKR